jgi:hypothetical protein
VTSGIFNGVRENADNDDDVSLRVRCLECSAVYEKPANGGTVESNPGCPECGYVGWALVGGVRGSTRRRSAVGRLRRPSD